MTKEMVPGEMVLIYKVRGEWNLRHGNILDQILRDLYEVPFLRSLVQVADMTLWYRSS